MKSRQVIATVSAASPYGFFGKRLQQLNPDIEIIIKVPHHEKFYKCPPLLEGKEVFGHPYCETNKLAVRNNNYKQ